MATLDQRLTTNDIKETQVKWIREMKLTEEPVSIIHLGIGCTGLPFQFCKQYREISIC